MIFSRSCEYALRAALYLASLDAGGYVSIRRISAELDISFPFLTKIFQQLTQAGLMESLRGPNGGIRLAKPASAIRLIDIVHAVEGPGLFKECVLGLPGCGERDPCPLHEAWSTERKRLHALFSTFTLQQAGAGIESGHFRLNDA